MLLKILIASEKKVKKRKKQKQKRNGERKAFLLPKTILIFIQ